MVTLEISGTSIRLMEFERGRVTKWASHSVEPGVLEGEVISDPEALGAAVRQLMTSSGIKAKNVTVSVSGLYSVSRIVTVPIPVGRRSAIQQEVLEATENIMPLNKEELYLSWQIIAPTEGGQQVLVLGVPRDVIDSETQALKAVGINPRVLDLKGMALARAVNRKGALILNIEPTSFDMVVIVNGVIEVMRTVAWQQDNLSVEDKAEHLTIAMELTVGFYNSHNPSFPLDLSTPLFITGQMSGDFALVEKLQERLGYPVETLAPPLQYPAHMPVSQYAVNIGLALKGTAPSKSGEEEGYSLPDINLLPQVYRPWKPSAKHIYSALAIVALIALLFPLYQVASDTMAKTATLQTRYTLINSLLEVRQAELRKRQPLQNAIDEYNTILNMGGGFNEDIQVINSQAEEFHIKVKSITHVDSNVTVLCQADSYTAFRDYLTALQESGRFTTPIPPPEGYPYVQGGTIKLEPKTSK